MSLRIRWTRLATTDLDEVVDPLRAKIISRVELLAEFPLMGPAMDGPFDGFRQIVVGKFRVIYEVAAGEIRIAYVRHGARQIGQGIPRGRRDE